MNLSRFIAQIGYNLLPKSVRDKIRPQKRYFQFLKISKKVDAEVRRQIHFFLRHESEIEALLEIPFMAGLLENVRTTEDVKGDIVELGAYKGGATIMIARFLKAINLEKQIYACDTFKGHPYNDRFPAKQRKGEFSDTSVSHVRSKLRRFNVGDKVTIIKGLFEDTLLKCLEKKRFSLAFVDCDLYNSTKYVLNFLYPRMAEKGKIIFHDYGSQVWGLTKAVDDWCEQKGLRVNLQPIPFIQIKRDKTS